MVEGQSALAAPIPEAEGGGEIGFHPKGIDDPVVMAGADAGEGGHSR